MPSPKPLSTLLLVAILSLPAALLFGQGTGTLPVTISGDTCVNSVLTVGGFLPAQSIVWTLNGTGVVSTQTASMQRTATTVAGGNGAGYGTNQLFAPDRLYVDADGTMYIPDLGNDRVQKWLPGATSGVTVAGGHGTGGAPNQFNRPTGLYVDAQGNIFVADQYNNRVQKWAPGAISGVTVAGSGNELYFPTGVFVDAQGNLYVSDQNNNRVLKYPPGSSAWTVVAGGNGYGNAPNQLDAPTGIFVDAAGNVYICDTNNSRVQKWAPGATAGVTVAGGNGPGFAPNQLSYPLGLFVDCGQRIYIADFYNSRVQLWAAGATYGTTVAGGNGAGAGANQLNTPASVFFDGDHNMYVSDFGNNRVQKYSNGITKSYTATVPGRYTAMVTTACGSVGTSNAIVIVPSKTPMVRISSNSRFVCPGVPVMFSATATYGGNNPVYQWKKNGVNVGSNLPTYSDNHLADRDVISCSLLSSERCVVTPDAVSNTIVMSKPVKPDLGPDTTVCPGSIVKFNAHSGYQSYRWQDGSGDSTFTASTQGTYSVQVTDFCQVQYSVSVSLSLYNVNTHFLPPDTAMCSYDEKLLQSAASFRQYLWNDGSTGPSLLATQPGLYWLQVTDEHACIVRESVLISLKACPPRGIYVPKAFTPNNDGRNDVFKPLVYGEVTNYLFSVYDRQGQVVFMTRDPGHGWDGRINGHEPEPGTYVWYYTCQFPGKAPRTEKGTVVLIR